MCINWVYCKKFWCLGGDKKNDVASVSCHITVNLLIPASPIQVAACLFSLVLLQSTAREWSDGNECHWYFYEYRWFCFGLVNLKSFQVRVINYSFKQAFFKCLLFNLPERRPARNQRKKNFGESIVKLHTQTKWGTIKLVWVILFKII